jgi:hypothetical protein
MVLSTEQLTLDDLNPERSKTLGHQDVADRRNLGRRVNVIELKTICRSTDGAFSAERFTSFGELLLSILTDVLPVIWHGMESSLYAGDVEAGGVLYLGWLHGQDHRRSD